MATQAPPTEKPTVSVLMSVYLVELAWLKRAVNSILNQSFTDFELLVFDDGASAEVGRYLESVEDPRVKLWRDGKNKGLAARLNEGLAVASGTYVARMDADDISHPERLTVQVAFMDSNPDIAASSGCFRILGDERVVVLPQSAAQCADWLWFTSPLCHPATIMRRVALQDLGLHYPAVPCAQDYGLWITLQQQGLKLANVPGVLLDYRQHGSSITQQNVAQKSQVLEQLQQPLLQKLLGHQPNPLQQAAHVGLALGRRHVGRWDQLRWLVVLLQKLPTWGAKKLALKKTVRLLFG